MNKVVLGIVIAVALIIIGVVGSILSFPIEDKIHPNVNEELINHDGITQINIDTTNSNVKVFPTKNKTIKVQLQSDNPKEELTTVTEDSTLSIKVKNKSWNLFSLDLFSQTPTLIVDLPEYSYELIKIKNDNGAIVMHGIAVAQLNAKTSNGRIELSDIDANITDFKTSNGKFLLTNIQGDISGKTSNGSITYNTKDLLQAIDLHTSNGKITINTTTGPTNNTLDLRTDFGKINVFGSSDWDTVIGNGNYLTKLRTDNGSITINNKE